MLDIKVWDCVSARGRRRKRSLKFREWNDVASRHTADSGSIRRSVARICPESDGERKKFRISLNLCLEKVHKSLDYFVRISCNSHGQSVLSTELASLVHVYGERNITLLVHTHKLGAPCELWDSYSCVDKAQVFWALAPCCLVNSYRISSAITVDT